MNICATCYLCNAIQQIVLETSCGFRFSPHFQITFSSVNFRANIKKLFECNLNVSLFFVVKAAIIYNLIVTMILCLTVIFGARQNILNVSWPVFSIRHIIFPDILNKEVYGILLTLTQNAYMYTPVFSSPYSLPYVHPRIRSYSTHV